MRFAIFRIAIVVAFVCGCCPTGWAFSDDPRVQELKKAFVGHTLFIRNFYTDPSLEFNDEGKLLGTAKSDCWLNAQLEVKKIRIKDGKLVLEGGRVTGTYDTSHKTVSNRSANEKVNLSIQLDPAHQTDHDIAVLLAKVLLTDKDNLEELVPIAYQSSSDIPGNKMAPLNKKINPDVIPPHPLYQPDPEYTDEARKLKLQGTLMLWMIVGTNGAVQEIKVCSCLGGGLERKSVGLFQVGNSIPAS